MEPIFLEIMFVSADLLAMGFEDRCEIEDELETALAESGVGEITGGGEGMGETNIDVDIDLEVNFEEALKFLRETLRRLRAPRSTVIIRHLPH